MSSESSTHEKFNASDADVIFQSSDGVKFRLHQRNLEIATGGFPPAGTDAQGEIVQLTEPASVLEVLFQYVYPMRHPDLEDKTFEEFFAIAKAVEKYAIFPGMTACAPRLRHFIPDHALDVLLHAIEHDYPKLINEAAAQNFCAPLVQVVEKIPPSWFAPWVRFMTAGRSEVFGDVRLLLDFNLVNGGSHCYLSEQGPRSKICNMCRCSILTWLGSVETLESRKLVELALETFASHPRLVFCAECHTDGQCMHMSAVVDLVKFGLAQIPELTSFKF